MPRRAQLLTFIENQPLGQRRHVRVTVYHSSVSYL
jgi:hypothetical protein